MAGKKQGEPISFRIEPEMNARLDGFIDSHRGWSKTQAVVVALHLFLEAKDEEQEAALVAYLRWLREAGARPEDLRRREEKPPAHETKKPGSGRLRPPPRK